MAAYISIPKLGMTMQDALLVEWKVNEGDHVDAGQIVLVIETAKTQWEVEATAAGYVHILVPADERANVARVVGLIAETKEELATVQAEPAQEIYTTVTEVSPEGAAEPAAAAAAAPPPKAEPGKHVRISPVAKKMAEEHMIDVTTVKGTGPDGRIVREDIEKAIEDKKKKPTAPAAAAPAGRVIDGKQVKDVIPLKGMRRAIAEHLHHSLQISAQLTSMGELDMTEMIKLRNLLVAQEKFIGTRITFTDILVLCIAKALKTNPLVNSSIIGNELIFWEDINVGCAVAIMDTPEGGLIVPVIKNADKKSLLQINAELRGAVEKARAGKLMPDDVTGGTFTLTNMGAFGGAYGFGTPIINQPESAIFGTGGTVDRPVVRDGQIVIRPIMCFNFTFDHRVIDGAQAGIFMMTLGRIIENPGLLLL
jgi:pyruvate dehydrogenase E2 component (dihydrolipoamide acetyltransferase)